METGPPCFLIPAEQILLLNFVPRSSIYRRYHIIYYQGYSEPRPFWPSRLIIISQLWLLCNLISVMAIRVNLHHYFIVTNNCEFGPFSFCYYFLNLILNECIFCFYDLSLPDRLWLWYIFLMQHHYPELSLTSLLFTRPDLCTIPFSLQPFNFTALLLPFTRVLIAARLKILCQHPRIKIWPRAIYEPHTQLLISLKCTKQLKNITFVGAMEQTRPLA